MTGSVVIYHYPCVDGVFSALAAHLHFKQRGESVRFFPLTVFKQHSVDELQLQGDETVYFCDFCGPPGFAVATAAAAKRIVILDHHKTAFETLHGPGVELPSNIDVEHMTMDKSGATIALDYFKPDVSQDLEKAFRFVEDADLWSWKLPGSKEFHSGMKDMDLEFDVNKNPGVLDLLKDLLVDGVLASGKLAMEAEEQFIAASLKQAFRVKLGGDLGDSRQWGIGLAVLLEDNSMSKHRSRLGNELAELSAAQGLQPIGVIAYKEPGMDLSMIKLSLRGVHEGTDTTPITEAFGGGGHRLASSCLVLEKLFIDSWKA